MVVHTASRSEPSGLPRSGRIAEAAGDDEFTSVTDQSDLPAGFSLAGGEGVFVEPSLELHVDDEVSVRTPAAPAPRAGAASVFQADFESPDPTTNPEGAKSAAVWASETEGQVLGEANATMEPAWEGDADADATMLLERSALAPGFGAIPEPPKPPPAEARPKPRALPSARPPAPAAPTSHEDPDSTVLFDVEAAGAPAEAFVEPPDSGGDVFSSQPGAMPVDDGSPPRAIVTEIATHASMMSIADDELGTLIIAAPRDAQVFVNGELRGSGQIVLDDLDRFTDMHVRVHRRGYRPWIATVSLDGKPAARVDPEFVRSR